MPELRCDIVDLYPFRESPDAVEFLQLRRADGDLLGGTWQAVHGRVETGETAWQAALRELHEETGLRPRRLWQVDAINAFYVARLDCVQLCPCFAADIDPAAQVRLCPEHSAWRWVPVVRRRAATGPRTDAPPPWRAAWRLSRTALRRFMWPGQRRAVREIVTEIVFGSAAEPHLRIDIPPPPAAARSGPVEPST